MANMMTFRSKSFGGTTLCLLAMLANCAGAVEPKKSKQASPPVVQKKAVAPATKIQKTAPMSQPPRPVSTVPRARDPQMAVQEEFDAAMAKNTTAGWDLFLARHGENVLAPRAANERSRAIAASQVKK